MGNFSGLLICKVQCLLYISWSDQPQLGEIVIQGTFIIWPYCPPPVSIWEATAHAHVVLYKHANTKKNCSIIDSVQKANVKKKKKYYKHIFVFRKQSVSLCGNDEGDLICMWLLCSERDERHVSATLRSIISCSSCTMSSLRLSCRLDILCSSSSLRCLTEETRCTGWWCCNVMSAGKKWRSKRRCAHLWCRNILRRTENTQS